MAFDIHIREKSSILLNMLHTVDCLLAGAMLWLSAKILREPWSDFYSNLVISSCILTFICFYSVNLYRPWRGIKLYKEFFAILKAWGIFACITQSLFFLFMISEKFSRLVIFTWLVATPVTIFLIHFMARKILGVMRKRGKNLRFAVIVGAGDLGLKLAGHIEAIPWAGLKITGFFDDKKNGQSLFYSNHPVLGTIAQLPDYLRNHKIDFVYIALPLGAESKIVSILKDCRVLGAQIFLVPDLFAFNIFNTEFQTLGDMLVINFNPDYRWKRNFDIIFSIIIILVSLPLTLLIALMIKLEGRGPIFYGHLRITLAGKEFKIWKFRTMVVDADNKLAQILDSDPDARREWDLFFKLKNDPRITRVGRILRNFSLDELPQFINVIKGEMSIVGARPVEHAQLIQHYKDNAGLYCSLKPGITGPWQVGLRQDMDDYTQRVKDDLWYLQNLSFWLDLKIIFKTIPVMLSGSGAY
jgi:putative colanic acid biosysnthesis UDP-glucose lipid carrier transferase